MGREERSLFIREIEKSLLKYRRREMSLFNREIGESLLKYRRDEIGLFDRERRKEAKKEGFLKKSLIVRGDLNELCFKGWLRVKIKKSLELAPNSKNKILGSSLLGSD